MADIGQKINIAGFRIASGLILGFTLVIALGRVFIKFHRFRRLSIDDILFIAATVILVAGTVTVSLTLPYNQTEVNVAAGIEASPSDLTHRLDLNVKLQDAAAFLLNGSIFAVKFSFLFFFRLLLQRTGKLQTWWRFVFVFTLPCAAICMCTNFMVCPAFGDRLQDVCGSDASLKRQFAALYTVVVLDIFTDVLLISIPILLLWNVKINIRRKVGLGSLLCLSVFAIITNIIRASGHKLKNGQDDVVWLLFWLEIEACVAVIGNSMTAFRSLFSTSSSSPRNLPPQNVPVLERVGRSPVPRIDLATMTTATLSGLKALLDKDPFENREMTEPDCLESVSGIRIAESSDAGVRRHSQNAQQDEKNKH